MRQICEFLKDMKRKRIGIQNIFLAFCFDWKEHPQKTASKVFNAFIFIMYLIKFAYILNGCKLHMGIENTEKENGKFVGFCKQV